LEGASVLDVGTGSGVWGTAFARAAPRVQVTYFDQPAVIERVRSNVERMGVGAQARYLSEDLFTHAFEAHAFDVVILPQVLNVLRPEDVPGLLARVARALRPGGVLVIAEYVLDEGRHGPLGHLYFGLRRFITNEGDLFSASEYAELLRAAGLPHARCFSLGSQEVIFGARSDVALPLQLVPEA
ncbi:MAG TPA: class I SAM-dependent methyltransferase, partial [Myxococcaceae bacterium]|nr:class I SAM-dependent methyltransferase [Myxococcaceae bacterium]